MAWQVGPSALAQGHYAGYRGKSRKQGGTTGRRPFRPFIQSNKLGIARRGAADYAGRHESRCEPMNKKNRDSEEEGFQYVPGDFAELVEWLRSQNLEAAQYLERGPRTTDH